MSKVTIFMILAILASCQAYVSPYVAIPLRNFETLEAAEQHYPMYGGYNYNYGYGRPNIGFGYGGYTGRPMIGYGGYGGNGGYGGYGGYGGNAIGYGRPMYSNYGSYGSMPGGYGGYNNMRPGLGRW